MDEDREDNNNERVVIDKERSNAGPIVAIVAIVVLVLIILIALGAFRGDTDEPDPAPTNPDTQLEIDGGTQ